MTASKKIEHASHSFSLLENILFLIIDRLNRTGSHTNPANIKQNIHTFLERTSKKFIDFIPENSTGIDIGSGYGILSDVLKPRLVYNLDKNPLKEGYTPQIKAMAEDLPFKDGKVDFATIFYAFNHFDDPAKAFGEASRVVKEGGYIVAMVEFLRYKGQDHLIRLNELSMNRIIYGEQNEPNEANNFFTRSDFEKLIDELSLQRRLVEDYRPTRRFDAIFKTSKALYVLQKY